MQRASLREAGTAECRSSARSKIEEEWQYCTAAWNDGKGAELCTDGEAELFYDGEAELCSDAEAELCSDAGAELCSDGEAELCSDGALIWSQGVRAPRAPRAPSFSSIQSAFVSFGRHVPQTSIF